MNPALLGVLCCPGCRGDLALGDAHNEGDEIVTGTLMCTTCSAAYPVRSGIPRFVPASNSVDSFGFQWNRFRRTQLDGESHTTISRDRFIGMTGWTGTNLAGRRVLDAGCGMGRFADIALSMGAAVTALDYSSAVDAAQLNLGHIPTFDAVQGDIYHLPFKADAFDYVYCLGVLQHTPDAKQAFMALHAPLRAGGELVTDVYPRLFSNLFWPKYWLRPLTRRIEPNRLFGLVQRMVTLLLPVSIAIGRIPFIGRKLRHVIPVVNYDGVYPLSREQLTQWSILDTFDMLAPTHDHPQTEATLRAWAEEAALVNVRVMRLGHIVCRGTKVSHQDRRDRTVPTEISR